MASKEAELLSAPSTHGWLLLTGLADLPGDTPLGQLFPPRPPPRRLGLRTMSLGVNAPSDGGEETQVGLLEGSAGISTIHTTSITFLVVGEEDMTTRDLTDLTHFDLTEPGSYQR